MWQALYERLRRTHAPDGDQNGTVDPVTFLRAPPPPAEGDDEPRCPACPGVRLVAEAHDPDHLRCIWCTRVFPRDELAPSSEAA